MKTTTLKIECDLCHRVFDYPDWQPWNGHHTPEPTIKIINKDVCRKCCKEILLLAKNTIEPDKRNLINYV